MNNLPPNNPEVARLMAEAMKAQMPNLKTQAQFTAFMLMFDSMRLLADSVFSGDTSREAEAREAFETSVKAAREITDLSRKFSEVPEAERTKAASAFVDPPAQFGEFDIQKRLLLELERIGDLAALNVWYQNTSGDRLKIVTPTLRNILIDAVRAKRLGFEGVK